MIKTLTNNMSNIFNIMKTFFLSAFLLITLLLLPVFLNTALGQPPPPPPQDIPLDGGLSILLAAGVAYGVRKIHKSDNKNNT